MCVFLSYISVYVDAVYNILSFSSVINIYTYIVAENCVFLAFLEHTTLISTILTLY
jgi:hypothetical protein